jgi:hypothetical protein
MKPYVDQRRIEKNTNPLVQLQANPNSRALAIKAMCAHCVGCTQSSLESGFRTAIAKCEVYHCPLHSFRPFAPKTALYNSNDIAADRYAEVTKSD